MKLLKLLAIVALGVGIYLFIRGWEPANRLVGTWELDLSGTLEDAVGEPGKTAAMWAEALAKGAGPMVTVRFRRDRTGEFTVGALSRSRTLSGRWKVVETSEGTTTIEWTPEGEEEGSRMEVVFLDEDRIELTPPGFGRPMRFRRVKEDR